MTAERPQIKQSNQLSQLEKQVKIDTYNFSAQRNFCVNDVVKRYLTLAR
jgi:hypothetical protein